MNRMKTDRAALGPCNTPGLPPSQTTLSLYTSTPPDSQLADNEDLRRRADHRTSRSSSAGNTMALVDQTTLANVTPVQFSSVQFSYSIYVSHSLITEEL